MASKNYKDLIAWQKAMDIVVDVYMISKTFPKQEVYGLTNQMRRCAVSIPSNLAEGQGRATPSDFCRYTRIAMGSVQELETQLLLAGRLEFAAAGAIKAVVTKTEEVARLIRGLEKSLS